MSQTIGKKRTAKTASTPLVRHPAPQSPKQPQKLRLVRAQAEQRVQLGMQLLNAAQVHTHRQLDLFNQFTAQQTRAREQMQNDIASTLQTYDQWMASFDQRFTERLKSMEEKIDSMQQHWSTTESKIAKLLNRAQALMDQSRTLRHRVAKHQRHDELQSSKLLASETLNPIPETHSAQRRPLPSPQPIAVKAKIESSPSPTRSQTQEIACESESTITDPPRPGLSDTLSSEKPENAAQPPTAPPASPIGPELIYGKAVQEARRQQNEAHQPKKADSEQS